MPWSAIGSINALYKLASGGSSKKENYCTLYTWIIRQIILHSKRARTAMGGNQKKCCLYSFLFPICCSWNVDKLVSNLAKVSGLSQVSGPRKCIRKNIPQLKRKSPGDMRSSNDFNLQLKRSAKNRRCTALRWQETKHVLCCLTPTLYWRHPAGWSFQTFPLFLAQNATAYVILLFHIYWTNPLYCRHISSTY